MASTTNSVSEGFTAALMAVISCIIASSTARRPALRADARYGVDSTALVWLNRLSDYFYLLGRTLTAHYAVDEVLWIP